MDKIIIRELAVEYRVGVPDEERAQTQKLTITMELDVDASAAAAMDDLTRTIDYFAITQWLLNLGQGRSWRLLESLAAEIAETVLARYKPLSITVEVRKFIIPQARYVAVRVTRDAGA